MSTLPVPPLSAVTDPPADKVVFFAVCTMMQEQEGSMLQTKLGDCLSWARVRFGTVAVQEQTGWTTAAAVAAVNHSWLVEQLLSAPS
jgi:hypothetical protein